VKALPRGPASPPQLPPARLPATAFPGRTTHEIEAGQLRVLPPATPSQRPAEGAGGTGVSGFLDRLAGRLGPPLRPGERRLDSPLGARVVAQKLDPKGSYAGAHLGEISGAARKAGTAKPRKVSAKQAAPRLPKKRAPKAKRGTTSRLRPLPLDPTGEHISRARAHIRRGEAAWKAAGAPPGRREEFIDRAIDRAYQAKKRAKKKGAPKSAKATRRARPTPQPRPATGRHRISGIVSLRPVRQHEEAGRAEHSEREQAALTAREMARLSALAARLRAARLRRPAAREERAECPPRTPRSAPEPKKGARK
jgi:hypothetical protein